MNAKEKEHLTVLCKRYTSFFENPKRLEDPYAHSRLVEEIESYLKDLYQRSKDSQLLVTLAITDLLTPLEDFVGSDKFCLQMLELQPVNPQAILILAFNDDYHRGFINEETLSKLSTIESHKDELISAKLYFEARYYEELNQNKATVCLEKSLAAFPGNLRAASYLLEILPKDKRSEQIARDASELAKLYNETEIEEPLYLLSFERFLHNEIFGVKENFGPIKEHLGK